MEFEIPGKRCIVSISTEYIMSVSLQNKQCCWCQWVHFYKGHGGERFWVLVEPLWPTYNKPTTYKHDKTQLLCNVRSNACAFSDCYFCAIAIYWIIDSKRWHFLFYVHASFRLVYNFTQHSGSNWLKENLVSLCFFCLFFSFLSCVANPSSILIFPFKLTATSQPYTPSVFTVVYP